MLKAAVIIPVYNHGTQVGAVIRQALQLALPVYVVDDGSDDSTHEMITSIPGVRVLQHAVNKGKGAALLTGFRAALLDNCNYGISIDGDGQHNPGDVKALLAAVHGDKRCIVLGRRQGMEGENVPWTSKFGRKFSNFWVWVSGGPLVEDSQSGFRLYPLPEVMELGVQARRYQFEVEILVKAKQQGIDILEAPVRVVYQAKGERVSHFRPWLDFWRNSAVFTRLIIARIFRTF